MPRAWNRRSCLLPIRGWSAITRKALRFALKISHEIYALHIAGDEQTMVALEDGWERLVREPATKAGLPAPKLIIIYSPFRRLYKPLIEVVSDLKQAHPDRDIAVIIPELIGTRWYHYVLHNQTAAVMVAYLRLSGFRRVVVINVPWYPEADGRAAGIETHRNAERLKFQCGVSNHSKKIQPRARPRRWRASLGPASTARTVVAAPRPPGSRASPHCRRPGTIGRYPLATKA